MKVAIIGTVGVPANYGGFETLVEQLVNHNKSEDLQYMVYCSRKSYNDKRWVYHGARMEYVALNANGIQSIPYDILSLIRASRKSDVILILGVSGCCFLPLYRLFSKKKLIINIDGLEHKRDKWSKWIRKFLKFSEAQAIRYGNVIISDNQGIREYVQNEYSKDSELIAYGGDHALTASTPDETKAVLNSYSLQAKEYALAICRIEPENNVHLILEAFEKAKKTLIFIGNWNNSDYGRELAEKYKNSDYVKITPAVYDLHKLNVLRCNCSVYLHGHSAGGTNPSLVEAMFFKVPIFAFDCVYNRESTENKAVYFRNSDDLISKLNDKTIDMAKNADSMQEIANRRYRWETIARQYESLF